MIFFKPWHYTFNMKVVLAGQEEYVVAHIIVFDANWALFVSAILSGFFDGKLFIELPSDSELSIDFVLLTFSDDSLKGFNVHTINRTFIWVFLRVIIIVLLIIDGIKFILPVYEIQIVLAGRIHLNRPVLPAVLSLGGVWKLILLLFWLRLLFRERVVGWWFETIIKVIVFLHFI